VKRSTTVTDLDAIRARHAAFEAAWDHEYMAPDGPKLAARSAEDVPALLAEVERASKPGWLFVGDYPPGLVRIVADLLADHVDLDVQEIGRRLRVAADDVERAHAR
jgi:hypothetical protein